MNSDMFITKPDAAVAALAAVVQRQPVRDGVHARVRVLGRMVGDVRGQPRPPAPPSGARLLDRLRITIGASCPRPRRRSRAPATRGASIGAAARDAVSECSRCGGSGLPHGARALDRRDHEPAQRAHRPQAGVDRAVLGRRCLLVPPREDHGAAAAAALAARLLRAGERHVRRAQIIDQEQVGRRILDGDRPPLRKNETSLAMVLIGDGEKKERTRAERFWTVTGQEESSDRCGRSEHRRGSECESNPKTILGHQESRVGRTMTGGDRLDSPGRERRLLTTFGAHRMSTLSRRELLAAAGVRAGRKWHRLQA